MDTLLSPSLSDRQGFNKRWFADSAALQVYRPTNAVEVVEAVTAIQTSGVSGSAVQITCGRHCYEGFVYNDQTRAIIDVTALKSYGQTTIDSVPMVYLDVGMGNWDMYRLLNNLYQKTIPAGSCYSVGLGGHITGGGYGILSRLMGLSIDYLSAVDIVVVQGGTPKLLTCTSTRNADLLWAVKGAGGGQFGLITRYYFATETLPEAPSYMFTTTYSWDWFDEAGNIQLSQSQFNGIVNTFFFGRYCNQGGGLNNTFGILHGNHMDAKSMSLADIDTYYASSGQSLKDYKAERTERITANRKLAQEIAPLSDRDCKLVGHPYIASTHALGVQFEGKQRLGGYGPDHIYTFLEGVQTLNGSGPNRYGKYKSAYHKTEFTTTMLDQAYAWLTTPVTISGQSGTVDMSQSLIQFDSYGGKINEVDSSTTAIYQRESIAKLQYQSYWTTNVGPEYDDEPLEEAHLSWMRHIYTGIYAATGGIPSGTGLQGCYYNYPDVDLGSTDPGTPALEQALELYFGPNLPRLKTVAATYNTGKWFSNSQSICNA